MMADQTPLQKRLTKQRNEADQDFLRTKEFVTGMVKAITTDLPGLVIDAVNGLSGDGFKPGETSDKVFEKVTGVKPSGSVTEQAGGMLDPRNLGKAMIVGFMRKAGVKSFEDFQKSPIAQKLMREVTSTEDKLKDNAELFNQTGVYRDESDGKLKSAISDKDAKVDSFEKARIQGSSHVAELDQILDHPQLFSLYPELRQLRVEGQTGTGAGFHGAKKGITIGTQLENDNFRSALLHEVQHAVQSVESFSRGSNPLAERQLNHTAAQTVLTEADKIAPKQAQDLRARLNHDRDAAMVRYMNVPGEQEARYTESTRNLSEPALGADLLVLLRNKVTPQTWDTKPVPSLVLKEPKPSWASVNTGSEF